MTIHYYPDISGGSPTAGSVLKFIDHLAKDEPKLYAMVRSTIDKLSIPGATMDSILPTWHGNLSHLSAPIRELRIPPTRSGGVVRLYYCIDKRSPNAIVILDGEVKKNNRASAYTKQAVKRYNELDKLYKGQ